MPTHKRKSGKGSRKPCRRGSGHHYFNVKVGKKTMRACSVYRSKGKHYARVVVDDRIVRRTISKGQYNKFIDRAGCSNPREMKRPCRPGRNAERSYPKRSRSRSRSRKSKSKRATSKQKSKRSKKRCTKSRTKVGGRVYYYCTVEKRGVRHRVIKVQKTKGKYRATVLPKHGGKKNTTIAISKTFYDTFREAFGCADPNRKDSKCKGRVAYKMPARKSKSKSKSKASRGRGRKPKSSRGRKPKSSRGRKYKSKSKSKSRLVTAKRIR